MNNGSQLRVSTPKNCMCRRLQTCSNISSKLLSYNKNSGSYGLDNSLLIDIEKPNVMITVSTQMSTTSHCNSRLWVSNSSPLDQLAEV